MNEIKPRIFSDVFDVQSSEESLKAIKRKGEDAFASGKILGQRTTYEFAIRFAELHEQARRDFFPPAAFNKLKMIFTNPHVVEGLETVNFLIHHHGLSYVEALSYRPAVFSNELIAAFKAAETDGNYSRHLLNFVKYRELIGANYHKFKTRDYKGLRKSLL